MTTNQILTAGGRNPQLSPLALTAADGDEIEGTFTQTFSVLSP